MAVAIMIGSTGNGKSALGNFLLNPDEDSLFSDTPYFKRAADNIPCTQDTKIATASISSMSLKEAKDLTLIDTPGLNESGEKDLDHMIGVVEMLQEAKTVSTCFIVVKFDSKIDQQYKDTVKYYAELLPDLFNSNLVVVMTNFDSSKRAQRKRTREKIDVKAIEGNTLEIIKETCGLSAKPMIFKIDSLPDEDDLDDNLKVRDAILDYVLYNCKPKQLTKFRIRKPKFLQEIDDKKVIELKGEIKTEELRVSGSNKDLKEAMKVIGELEYKIMDVNTKISNAENDLRYKDTNDYVDVSSWYSTHDGEFLTYWTSDFNIASEHRLRNAKKWKKGGCEWKNEKNGDYLISIRIESGWNCYFYAQVTYQTYRKDKFAGEIGYLKNTIEAHKTTHSSLKNETELQREKNSQYEVQIQEQKEFIDERRGKVNELSVETMSIEEAGKRLKEIGGGQGRGQ